MRTKTDENDLKPIPWGQAWRHWQETCEELVAAATAEGRSEFVSAFDVSAEQNRKLAKYGMRAPTYAEILAELGWTLHSQQRS